MGNYECLVCKQEIFDYINVDVDIAQNTAISIYENKNSVTLKICPKCGAVRSEI
jgi:hypothetical protein